MRRGRALWRGPVYGGVIFSFEKGKVTGIFIGGGGGVKRKG